MMFMRQQNQRQSVENSTAEKTLNNCVNKRQKSESIANRHEVRISELCASVVIMIQTQSDASSCIVVIYSLNGKTL